MKPIIDPKHRKFIVVALAALVSFWGFEAVSQAIASYQIGYFLKVSVYVYLFLVFWESFIFDLRLKETYQWNRLDNNFWDALKKRFAYMVELPHWAHYQNYLVLPGIIYWATVVLLYLNPFDVLLKQTFILSSTLALGIAFWYLKTVFYAHSEVKQNTKQLLFLAKIYASYAVFAAILGIGHYFGFSTLFVAAAVFSVNYLLFHQAFFQHHFVRFQTVVIMMAASLVIAETASLVYLFWNVNYFSGALVITAVYNTAWGFVQHKFIDRDLTREIVYEYLSVLFVILVLLINTTNFSQRIY